jgi:glycosyltransferase involved in cell wall biosynthesis
VPSRSPEVLADAIAALAADPTLCARLSEAARARVVRDFRSAQGAETLIAGARRALAVQGRF